MSNLDNYFDMLELTVEAYADHVNLYYFFASLFLRSNHKGEDDH